jgi:hypothetical protein
MTEPCSDKDYASLRRIAWESSDLAKLPESDDVAMSIIADAASRHFARLIERGLI